MNGSPQTSNGVCSRRSKCATCKYRTELHFPTIRKGEKPIGCVYILHTGHMRGCSPEECDKYEPGRAKRLKNPDEWARGKDTSRGGRAFL